MFKEVYVRPRDELKEQLHSTSPPWWRRARPFWRRWFPPEDAGFHIKINTLDQTLDNRHGNVSRGLGKAYLQDPSASSSRQRTEEVQTLTSEVANLKERIAA